MIPLAAVVVRRDFSPGGVVHTVIHTVLSPITASAGAVADAAISAIQGWALSGVKAAIGETAHVIGEATAPRLESAWFSATYWRVAAVAMLLTLPFLFAAAVQALLRSDVTLLLRSAFGYLPLAVIGVTLASQVVMALLAATDEMSAFVAGSGTDGGARFLIDAVPTGVLAGVSGSAFFAFVIALFTVGAALALTLELLVRAAAVYVVMLMLPLAFAALVWPARRIWAVRLCELLVGLILSKFVIVAVLSLAGSAYAHSGYTGISLWLTAMSLLLLSCFAPWAMMRLLPFAELAAGAAGSVRAELPASASPIAATRALSSGWVDALPAMMGRQADDAGQGFAGRGGVFGSPPAPGRASTGEDGPSTGGDGASTGGDGPSTGGDGASTGGDRPSTGGDGASTGEDGPSTGGDGPSTGRDDPGPPAAGPGGGGPSPEPAPAGGPAAASPPAAPQEAAPRERIPGMIPMFQVDDGGWPPMSLDEGDWWGGAPAPADQP